MAQSVARKKVLIAITKSNWGGAQRYVYDLATHLPKDEFEIVVMHGGNGALAEKLQGVLIRTIQIHGLGRDVNTRTDLSSLRSMLRIIRAEQPDILHLNSSKVGLLGALAGRIAGVPRIVFTAHGWPFNEDRSFFQRVLLRFLALCTVVLSHRTIAVSDSVARNLGHRIRRITTIVRNGVTTDTFMQRNEARATLVQERGQNEFWFGTIAELHPIKGLTYAIEAFRQHAALYPNARYVLIGEGEERARLEAQIQTSGYADRIHLSGFHDDANRHLKAFDAFVVPSLSEALSYSILEAGVAQIPVIATHVGGIPEIINDGEDGMLVPPRDSHALASAMERIQNDAKFRASLASALHARVLRQFSLESMVEKTVAVYR